MDFAQKLKTLMDTSNITAYKLSKDIGVHQTTIKNWIDGKYPSAVHLSKIANYFGTTVDRLISDELYQQKPDRQEFGGELVNNDLELTEFLEVLKNREEMRMLFKLTKKASKADVEKAVKIIEALLGD